MTEQHAELGKFRQHLIDMLMEAHRWEPRKAEMFAERVDRHAGEAKKPVPRITEAWV